jgi:hypothetical protein
MRPFSDCGEIVSNAEIGSGRKLRHRRVHVAIYGPSGDSEQWHLQKALRDATMLLFCCFVERVVTSVSDYHTQSSVGRFVLSDLQCAETLVLRVKMKRTDQC